jgi:hypothetical protein
MSGCKIGKITLKGGAQLHLLDDKQDAAKRAAFKRIRGQMSVLSDLAGFVFVAWQKNTESTAAYGLYEPSIPSASLPDFLRNRVLLDIAEDWAVQRFEDIYGK